MPKKAAKKERTPREAPLAVGMSLEERRARINKLLAASEKTYGAGCVQVASQTNMSYLLRRPTGIMSLDLALAGGFPASAPSVIVGPDGAGKDYLLWRTAAETQRIYGDDFCMAVYFTEFRPDKRYMKDFCGLQIAFSEEELLELDQARHSKKLPGLTADELDHYRRQIGEFISIVGISADQGFDQLFEFLDANICQIIAVNSIGFLQTEAKESVDSFEEFAQRSSEATLLSKALPKFAMYLNRGSNETSLLLLNQVRSNDTPKRAMPGRPVLDRDQYKTAANAWALKHGKAIELMIHNAAKIYDHDDKSVVLGRKKQWELTKGKLGTHEGLKGEFNYYYGEGADIAGDLIATAVQLGVIEMSGAWLTYPDKKYGFRCQGEPKAVALLNKEDSGELINALRDACFQVADVTFRDK
jgi:KaiC/GvpD/RAD55 family RecA-like ATPase